MLIIQSGTLTYYWKRRAGQKRNSRVARPSFRGTINAQAFAPTFSDGNAPISCLPDGELLRPKQWISEAALWVEWENRGECAVEQQCSALALESQELTKVLKLFKDARARSVVYARKF